MTVDEYIYIEAACSGLKCVLCGCARRSGPQEGAWPACSSGKEVEGCDWAPTEKLTPQADTSCF